MPTLTIAVRDDLGQQAQSSVTVTLGGGILRWSSPASWPELGHVPTRNDSNVVIPVGRTILLDIPNAECGSLTINGTLTNMVGISTQLTMYGNLINADGFVDFDAARGSWFVQFMISSESLFVGGGDIPLATDIGWWTTGSGRNNLIGSPKTSWTHLVSAVSAGISVITVQNSTGWRIGDEIAVVPTESPAVVDFHDHYDTRTVTGIIGNTLTLSSPLTFTHPTVTVRPGVTYTAEVLNLTRTGRIEGRPGLRTHFWMHNTATAVHTIRYVQFRYLGPQRFDGSGNLNGVLGRWGGPHFHMGMDFVAGSLVEGCVSRDFGNHAFVTHDSNNVTLRNNIAHDGFNDAYWYDNRTETPTAMGPTGLLYDSCIASRLQFIPAFRGYVLTGFFIGQIMNGMERTNEARNCVSVGVQGGSTSSGFEWPEASHGVWIFNTGNLAHNNAVNGIFAWQNDSRAHVIQNFTAYHNGKSGVQAGAYLNSYQWGPMTLYGNHGAGAEYPGTGLILNAMSDNPNLTTPPRITNVYIDAGGALDAIETKEHSAPPAGPLYIIGCTLTNYTRAGIALVDDQVIEASIIDVDATTTFSGNRYWINTGINPASQIIDHSLRLIIRPSGQPGTFRPEWNASATPF